mmetsp:Transcript_13038/g.31475  ORF Transcript_13038/g.31475 Transcript_13038/m.31475 type:complete len:102 (-) Transcript_13038:354-659(-)
MFGLCPSRDSRTLLGLSSERLPHENFQRCPVRRVETVSLRHRHFALLVDFPLLGSDFRQGIWFAQAPAVGQLNWVIQMERLSPYSRGLLSLLVEERVAQGR